ncbi:MAG: hypothetical protein KBB51_01455 [Candidatus Moranbacteria bacterium]|jgi:hypothetical protein|nr:hypothetical protein [Candidatus Moranbacteria bacterium]
MRIDTGKDPSILAQKRKIEMEVTLLSSDMKKAERAVLMLRTENRSLENQKKRIILELDRNASLLRTQESVLQKIIADLAVQKKRLNTVH